MLSCRAASDTAGTLPTTAHRSSWAEVSPAAQRGQAAHQGQAGNVGNRPKALHEGGPSRTSVWPSAITPTPTGTRGSAFPQLFWGYSGLSYESPPGFCPRREDSAWEDGSSICPWCQPRDPSSQRPHQEGRAEAPRVGWLLQSGHRAVDPTLEGWRTQYPQRAGGELGEGSLPLLVLSLSPNQGPGRSQSRKESAPLSRKAWGNRARSQGLPWASSLQGRLGAGRGCLPAAPP